MITVDIDEYLKSLEQDELEEELAKEQKEQTDLQIDAVANQEQATKETSYVGSFMTGSKGVAAGAFKGVEGLAEYANSMVNPLIGIMENTFNVAKGGEWDHDLYEKEYFAEKGIDLTPSFLDITEEDGTIAKLNRDVFAFFANYGLARKGIQQLSFAITNPQKVGKRLEQSWTLGKDIVAGVVADVTAFDPEDGTAVDALLHHFPQLENPVLNFLTTDENDIDAVIKLKQALEGAGITGGLHAIIKGLSYFKSIHTDYINKKKRIINEEELILKEASKKGILADDAADAKRQLDELPDKEFIIENVGPNEVRVIVKETPKTKTPDKREVLMDQPNLINSIKNADTLDDVDLPINVNNFKSSEDVQKVIEAAVKEMQPQFGAKWSKTLSNKDVDELSSMMDMEADVLANGLKSIDNIEELPVRVVATKKALQGLAFEARRLSKAYVLGNKDIATRTELVKTYALLQSTVDQLKTAIKAAARTTQAGKIKTGAAYIDTKAISNIVRAFDGNIDDFAEKFAKVDDFSSLNKILELSFSRRAWNAAIELYINALLSGPITQAINLASTAVETFVRPMELLAGGAVTAYTREGRRSMRLAFSRYRGMTKGVYDTLRAVGKAFKEGDLFADKGGRVIEQMKPKAASSQNFPGLQKTTKIGSMLFDFVGGTLRIPSRLLVTGDELFKQINYRAKLHEMAVNDALKMGLKGQEFDSYIKNFEKNGFDEIGRFTNKEAIQYARVSTFTEDLASGAFIDIGGAMQDAIQRAPVLKVMLPFVRTPSNLFRHALQRLPIVGMLQKQNVTMLKAGGAARSEVLGRSMLGGLLLYAAWDAVMNEEITGRGPKNPALREGWLLTHKPYSKKVINEDGTNDWVAYNRMDPRFFFMGIVADLHYFMDENNPEHTDILVGLMVSVISNMSSKTYLSGVVDAATAVGTESPNRTANWIRKFVTGFVPLSSFMRQTNNDEAMREVRSLADELSNIAWGDDEKLPPKRNVLGHIQYKNKGVVGKPGWWWMPYVVGKTGTTKNKPLYVELSKLAKSSTTDPGKGITKQQKNLSGTNIDLTDEKYRHNGKLPYDLMLEMLTTYKMNDKQNPLTYGKTVEEALDALIESPGYQQERQGAGTGFLNEPRAKMIRKVYAQYKENIRKIVILNNPKLKEDYFKVQTDKAKSYLPVEKEYDFNSALQNIIEY